MNENLILEKLVDHEERLTRIEQNMATKADMRNLHNYIDEAMVILKRLDQERVITAHRIEQIELKLR